MNSKTNNRPDSGGERLAGFTASGGGWEGQGGGGLEVEKRWGGRAAGGRREGLHVELNY